MTTHQTRTLSDDMHAPQAIQAPALSRRNFVAAVPAAGLGAAALGQSQDQPPDEAAIDSASITGTEQGWRAMGEADFQHVNCDPDTWTWSGDQVHCTGNPLGVIRSVKPWTNFEMTCQWRHLRDAGNSGIFIWSPKASLDRLTGPGLPEGIECQVLDLGYAVNYAKSHGTPDWFTCHGDVFPVGASTMKPFAPVSPNGRRSFPTAETTRGVGKWNHYYIRAINGEVRLWVNGREVSGGNDCNPRTGYLALESEGSPIDFRRLRIRELP